MDQEEFSRRIQHLNPIQIKQLRAILSRPPPSITLTSSIVEKVSRYAMSAPFIYCEKCKKMEVRQSLQDSYVLENSCQYREERKWNEESHRMECPGWVLRHKGEVEEGDETD